MKNQFRLAGAVVILAASIPVWAAPQPQEAAAGKAIQEGKGHAFACADYSQGKIFLVSAAGRVEWEYPAPFRAVVTCPLFFAGVSFLALAFFSLLLALNHLNLSLVAPASASLTLVTNAIAGKIFLKENVDRRRWAAALLVCVGVYLLAH